MTPLEQAIHHTRTHLLSLRNRAGHWEGHLASSALATATAIVALSLVDEETHAPRINTGAAWLNQHQNPDGGWGDTPISKSNLSTTLLCWSALHLIARQHACACPDAAVNHANADAAQRLPSSLSAANAWLRRQIGILKPAAIRHAVVARYGRDKTFSVPILMLCAICGTLGERPWRHVLPLPFELAALPRSWFGAIGLPVVSYALPALIAIGYARHHHAPFTWLNPLRWLKTVLWPRISPMLKLLQPDSGGYLEATPLTSFVTMALASAGQQHHACIPAAVRFLQNSQRPDGSWPIDTNLATWGTTLAVKALHPELDHSLAAPIIPWLLNQQYRSIHPFTNAPPGGWAWTDLPGGVPDADDTAGALIALHHLHPTPESRKSILPAIQAALTWLLNLQNRDGGMPTFCCGWGALPFDRSTPEITAHALKAFALWFPFLPSAIQHRLTKATNRAWRYLARQQRPDGSWLPLWFGNEHTSDEENPIHGAATVLQSATHAWPDSPDRQKLLLNALHHLLRSQSPAGGWGGGPDTPCSIEETANALTALQTVRHLVPAKDLPLLDASIKRAISWLLGHTRQGTHFPSAPIGLYFARLWYHDQLYPVVWTLAALSVHAKAENVSLRT